MAGAKEDEVYVVLSSDGAPGWGVEGVFFRDTVYFDEWRWDVGDAQRLTRRASGGEIQEYHCLTRSDRSQAVGLRRHLKVDDGGFQDTWELTNSTAEEQTVALCLQPRPRMVDIFAARTDEQVLEIVPQRRDGSLVYTRSAEDGVVHGATISCSDGEVPDRLQWNFVLPPGGSRRLTLDVRIASSEYQPKGFPPLPSLEDWSASFANVAGRNAAVDQAVADLRSLLIRTEHGPYPAAGLPIFINFFGRDALITGMMLLEWRPSLLRTVLSFLASRQGRVVDTFREEEPGKIMHEIRRGELSRTDRIPFGRYYGSVDATPLFLMAAGAYFDAQEDGALRSELQHAIEAATDWLTRHLEGPSGLATFQASGSGLTVQSWKDSANSMVDEHGEAARQPLAVAEVQGYAYAALLASAQLLPDRADDLTRRTAALRETFHKRFWLPGLKTYAMALDADLEPLRVLSSDPGHLLWTGVVPDEVAPILVETLMGEALWSGWGLRTLGSGEVAYNPVSYHNGSVWPHDTGIFGMGLWRYGFRAEARIVAEAMLDLAAASPGHQIPELISGFGRGEHPEPVPYTHANAPQAWAAAAVIRMAGYLCSMREAAL